MIRLTIPEVDPETQGDLDALQAAIDEVTEHEERVRILGDRRDSRSWERARARVAFRRVEGALRAACADHQRCMFCEDSQGAQIEHFRPKSIYPSLAFRWSNYLFACGLCNGPKSNRFALFSSDGSLIEVRRGPNEPPREPAVLLDPRVDDPMDFLDLDVRTGRFLPSRRVGAPEHERARVTIEWLGLNRQGLPEQRRAAYKTFSNALLLFVEKGDTSQKQHVERLPHVTVFREMQRRHEKLPEIAGLFARAPEALRWTRT